MISSASPMPMPLLLFLLLLFSSVHLTLQRQHSLPTTLSISFPLSSVPLSNSNSSSSVSKALHFLSSKATTAAASKQNGHNTFDFNFQSPFKYSMALVVSLPIGTPPQSQQMVLDTGSQLSWIQCLRKSPPKASFDPSRSSSFSVIPCNHPACKPSIPDFTIPTTCDQKRLCHYSYFYADGTLAEGNLVTEKFALGTSKATPPLVLGCAAKSSGAEAEGILGMNLGRLSFVSQAKVPRFSYCVPSRQGSPGRFYLGQNPNSRTFRYTNLLASPGSRGKPNFDPFAYTVGLVGIKIGGKLLNIPPAVFRPDAGGSGQTMIDSGTQYTFLVEAAYAKVKEEVVRVAGSKLKKGYVYGGSLDMCYDEKEAAEMGRLIGDMAFEFENGVEILVGRERIADGVGGGVECVGIGRSESLGMSSNIIGNFHQRDHWVEFDVANKRVGFAVADCARTK